MRVTVTHKSFSVVIEGATDNLVARIVQLSMRVPSGSQAQVITEDLSDTEIEALDSFIDRIHEDKAEMFPPTTIKDQLIKVLQGKSMHMHEIFLSIANMRKEQGVDEDESKLAKSIGKAATRLGVKKVKGIWSLGVDT